MHWSPPIRCMPYRLTLAPPNRRIYQFEEISRSFHECWSRCWNRRQGSWISSFYRCKYVGCQWSWWGWVWTVGSRQTPYPIWGIDLSTVRFWESLLQAVRRIPWWVVWTVGHWRSKDHRLTKTWSWNSHHLLFPQSYLCIARNHSRQLQSRVWGTDSRTLECWPGCHSKRFLLLELAQASCGRRRKEDW